MSTAIDEDVELFNSLEEALPCEHEPCVSNHEEPATWFGTHKGGQDKCARLFCDPCRLQVIEFMKKADKYTGGKMICKACWNSLYTSDIIWRKL